MPQEDVKADIKASPKGSSEHTQETFWQERSAVLEAEKEYHEKLAAGQSCDGRPEEEKDWVQNLRREFVWFDRLEVLEAEKNHYAKLAREEADVSEVGLNLVGLNFSKVTFIQN